MTGTDRKTHREITGNWRFTSHSVTIKPPNQSRTARMTYKESQAQNTTRPRRKGNQMNRSPGSPVRTATKTKLPGQHTKKIQHRKKYHKKQQHL